MSEKKQKRIISIGCDPELFAFRGGIPVSVHDILPGTKYDPCTVPNGAIQVDGVAAEFNITPAYSRKEFLLRINHVTRTMVRLLQNHDPSLYLLPVPSVTFDKKYFDALPAETKALGCEPDYNAYTKEANPKPETDLPMRTGSGHVHIGWSDVNQEAPEYIDTCCNLVKELDFVLYKQSHAWDTDITRASLYGKPGAFRFKPYGLEYRVLSNRWLRAESISSFVYDATKAVTARVLAGQSFVDRYTGSSENEYLEFLRNNRLPIAKDVVSQ